MSEEDRGLSIEESLRLPSGLDGRRRLQRRALAAPAIAGAALVAGAAPLWAAPAVPRAAPSIGIVGAGLAGLACGDELKRAGVPATLYEAGAQVGGRCSSLNGFFPGQAAERGGEFIDNLHKTMLGYAKRFGLAREEMEKTPGEVSYFVDGRHHAEAAVVEEFRTIAPVLRADAAATSGTPTADRHTAEDVRLDRVSLAAYLDGANGRRQPFPRLLREVIRAAYEGEYGLDAGEQSCLNFLLLVHADRRSKLRPFGVFSDERWHIVEGNGKIAEELAAGLTGQIELDMRLVAVRKTSAGRVELTLKQGVKTVTRVHDAVVLTLPFSVLRDVALDESLRLPDEKISAIQHLGYGTNAKTMIGFSGRPWVVQGADGTVFANLSNVQIAWETNPINASSSRAVVTDYASGTRGVTVGALGAQQAAGAFLADLDRVFTGTSAAATRVSGTLRVHREHWPSNPLAKGSYTCYRPGQFTTIAGHEGTSVGNVYFAGEHTNSFYEWQGFMEGACLSGLHAAARILADRRVGTL